jgi:hypothetical protein
MVGIRLWDAATVIKISTLSEISYDIQTYLFPREG